MTDELEFSSDNSDEKYIEIKYRDAFLWSSKFDNVFFEQTIFINA